MRCARRLSSLCLCCGDGRRAPAHSCAWAAVYESDMWIYESAACRRSRGATLAWGSSTAVLSTTTELRTLGCAIEAVLGSAKRWDVYDGVQLQPFFVRAFAAVSRREDGSCTCQETYLRPRAAQQAQLDWRAKAHQPSSQLRRVLSWVSRDHAAGLRALLTDGGAHLMCIIAKLGRRKTPSLRIALQKEQVHDAKS